MNYITRIAPSPTGPTHLGTMRTAYFNWLAAKASGGKFIVRIDDSDQERSEERWASQFIASLDWLGLDYDGPYYQSKRIDLYNSYAENLIKNGLAKNHDGRICLSLNGVPKINSWHDALAGEIPIRPDNVAGFESLTLIKADGYPTYHFASCVDDVDMKVNFVIRGVDHITNTSKHVLLYSLLQADLPKYSHVGLLRTKEGKLSKRDAVSNFQTYIEQQYHPAAILNFLARLGWGPSVDDKTKKLLTKENMIELFLHGGKMKNKDSVLNFDLLDSYDRKYKARQ